MRLIDADELKRNIGYETVFENGNTWDWQEVLKAIDDQPTVVVSADEMRDCLQKRIEELNKEIRKWGARREV